MRASLAELALSYLMPDLPGFSKSFRFNTIVVSDGYARLTLAASFSLRPVLSFYRGRMSYINACMYTHSLDSGH